MCGGREGGVRLWNEGRLSTMVGYVSPSALLYLLYGVEQAEWGEEDEVQKRMRGEDMESVADWTGRWILPRASMYILYVRHNSRTLFSFTPCCMYILQRGQTVQDVSTEYGSVHTYTYTAPSHMYVHTVHVQVCTPYSMLEEGDRWENSIDHQLPFHRTSSKTSWGRGVGVGLINTSNRDVDFLDWSLHDRCWTLSVTGKPLICCCYLTQL